jgi:hypothetical protein
MRPTLLKPGQQVVCDGRMMLFVRRDKGYCARPGVNVFRCDDYRGLNGPADDGTCTMTDYRVSRFVNPKPQIAANK